MLASSLFDGHGLVKNSSTGKFGFTSPPERTMIARGAVDGLNQSHSVFGPGDAQIHHNYRAS